MQESHHCTKVLQVNTGTEKEIQNLEGDEFCLDCQGQERPFLVSVLDKPQQKLYLFSQSKIPSVNSVQQPKPLNVLAKEELAKLEQQKIQSSYDIFTKQHALQQYDLVKKLIQVGSERIANVTTFYEMKEKKMPALNVFLNHLKDLHHQFMEMYQVCEHEFQKTFELLIEEEDLNLDKVLNELKKNKLRHTCKSSNTYPHSSLPPQPTTIPTTTTSSSSSSSLPSLPSLPSSSSSSSSSSSLLLLDYKHHTNNGEHVNGSVGDHNNNNNNNNNNDECDDDDDIEKKAENDTLLDHCKEFSIEKLEKDFIHVKDVKHLLTNQMQLMKAFLDSGEKKMKELEMDLLNDKDLNYQCSKEIESMQEKIQQQHIILKTHEQMINSINENMSNDPSLDLWYIIQELKKTDYISKLKTLDEELREDEWKCGEKEYKFHSSFFRLLGEMYKQRKRYLFCIAKLKLYMGKMRTDIITRFNHLRFAIHLPFCYKRGLEEADRRNRFKEQLMRHIDICKTKLMVMIGSENSTRASFDDEVKQNLGPIRFPPTLIPGLIGSQVPMVNVDVKIFDEKLPNYTKSQTDQESEWELVEDDFVTHSHSTQHNQIQNISTRNPSYDNFDMGGSVIFDSLKKQDSQIVDKMLKLDSQQSQETNTTTSSKHQKDKLETSQSSSQSLSQSSSQSPSSQSPSSPSPSSQPSSSQQSSSQSSKKLKEEKEKQEYQVSNQSKIDEDSVQKEGMENKKLKEELERLHCLLNAEIKKNHTMKEEMELLQKDNEHLQSDILAKSELLQNFINENKMLRTQLEEQKKDGKTSGLDKMGETWMKQANEYKCALEEAKKEIEAITKESNTKDLDLKKLNKLYEDKLQEIEQLNQVAQEKKNLQQYIQDSNESKKKLEAMICSKDEYIKSLNQNLQEAQRLIEAEKKSAASVKEEFFQQKKVVENMQSVINNAIGKLNMIRCVEKGIIHCSTMLASNELKNMEKEAMIKQQQPITSTLDVASRIEVYLNHIEQYLLLMDGFKDTIMESPLSQIHENIRKILQHINNNLIYLKNDTKSSQTSSTTQEVQLNSFVTATHEGNNIWRVKGFKDVFLSIETCYTLRNMKATSVSGIVIEVTDVHNNPLKIPKRHLPYKTVTIMLSGDE